MATVLTPRQDRLEAAIRHAFQVRSTRSDLRDAVHQLVDLFRLQQIPVERGIEMIMSIAARAVRTGGDTDSGAVDFPLDRLRLIEHWSAQRYVRGD